MSWHSKTNNNRTSWIIRVLPPSISWCSSDEFCWLAPSSWVCRFVYGEYPLAPTIGWPLCYLLDKTSSSESQVYAMALSTSKEDTRDYSRSAVMVTPTMETALLGHPIVSCAIHCGDILSLSLSGLAIDWNFVLSCDWMCYQYVCERLWGVS